MIKAAIFDYGGVITDGRITGIVDKNLAHSLNVSQEDAGTLLENNLHDYIRGRIDTPQFWENIESDYGSVIPAEARDVWYKWEEINPMPEMIRFRDKIRKLGYKTALLSNTEPIVGEFLRNKGAYAGFDEVALSYEIGFAKPDEEAYHAVLARLALRPDETLYVDDRLDMLLPAEGIGIHTIHGISSTQIMRDVSAALHINS